MAEKRRSLRHRARALLGRLTGRRPELPWWMVRPFDAADLRPLEAGDEVSGPDFVGVGTPKAGTTWWHRLLLSHPAVRENRIRVKEVQYLCHFGYQPLGAARAQTYRQAFARRPGEICGEWTPNYLTHPFALERLHAAAPAARILVMLRHPVDRAVSGLNHLGDRLHHWRLEPRQASFLWTFSFFPEALGQGLLAPAVRSLLAKYERSQVLFLQYERCKVAPLEELARTFRFLGVAPDHAPQTLRDPANVRPRRVPSPSSEERAELVRFFAEDVRELARLVPELDLSLWPEFEAGMRG